MPCLDEQGSLETKEITNGKEVVSDKEVVIKFFFKEPDPGPPCVVMQENWYLIKTILGF